jgi:transposase-like protein
VPGDLQSPIFTDETRAREWLETRVWPNGVVCPHCGNADKTRIGSLNGESHRPGLYQCNQCRGQFTVTVGTVFERSKIPLGKWLAALFLLVSSNKRVSARQIHRRLGVSYKSSWFMLLRLREAIGAGGLAAAGGEGRSALGVEESQCAEQLATCVAGNRLTFRRAVASAQA